MSQFKTRDDLRAEARRRGMVDAAVGDVAAMEKRQLGRNSMRHRVGATTMRELGLSEEQVVAKYGYSPDPMEDEHVMMSRPAA